MFRIAVMLCSTLMLGGAVRATDRPTKNPIQIDVLWSSPTPVISPTQSGPASAGAFNPAAVRSNGKTILLYREQDSAGTSRIGYASSKDGIHFTPSLVLESEPGEFSYPAIIQASDGTVHATYTWNRKKIKHVAIQLEKFCVADVFSLAVTLE